MQTVWKVCFQTGLVLGPVVVVVAFVLDGLGASQIALPFWAWEAAGATTFFAAIIGVVYQGLETVAHESGDSPQGQRTPAQGAYFANQRLHVVDLITSESDHHIRGKKFVDCILVGPAMMYLKDSLLEDTTNSDLSHFSVDTPPGEELRGVIIADGCVFQRCRFEGLGVIEPPT